jgi:hypothetical protein
MNTREFIRGYVEYNFTQWPQPERALGKDLQRVLVGLRGDEAAQAVRAVLGEIQRNG